ncbi:MAG: hypothetical protein ACYC6K_04105 [Bellilinea sp.]
MNLTPEIQGAIIGALIGGFILFVGFYFRTHTGNKVIVRKLRETSLLSISKLVSDKLSINYKGIPIGKLKLYELELTNEGFIDIENFTLTLEITPFQETEVIEVQVTDSQSQTKLEDTYLFDNCFYINRPYLNMIKKNKIERIDIQIFTDTELNFRVIGGGKGWGAFYRKNQKYKISFPLILSCSVALALSILKLISGDYQTWDSWLGILIGLGVVGILEWINYLATLVLRRR